MAETLTIEIEAIAGANGRGVPMFHVSAADDFGGGEMWLYPRERNVGRGGWQAVWPEQQPLADAAGALVGRHFPELVR